VHENVHNNLPRWRPGAARPATGGRRAAGNARHADAMRLLSMAGRTRSAVKPAA